MSAPKKAKTGMALRYSWLRTGLSGIAFLGVTVLGLVACLGDNNLTPQGYIRTISADSTSALTSSGSTAAGADGAKGSCASLEEGSTERAYCVGCYTSLLGSLCQTSATESSQCLDPNVRDNFQNLLNQCVSASIQRGFVCTRSCPAGSRIDLNSCTCVPTESTTGASAIANTDVGLSDSGPPLASLLFNYPSSLALNNGVLSTTSCTINAAFPLAIRNRGNTVSRANSMGTPEVLPTPTASAVSILGSLYLQSAPAPVPTTGLAGQTSGAYTHSANLSILTGGSQEVTTANPYVSVTLSNRVLLTTYSDGGVPRSFGNFGPFMGSSDKWGNLYYTDTSNHTVVVVCYDSSGLGPHWCPEGTRPGTAIKIAGVWAQSGFTGHRGGVATLSSLNRPRGVAVDFNGNVYFSEENNGLIRMICAGTRASTSVAYSVGGMCAQAAFTTLFNTASPTVGSLHTIAGRLLNTAGMATPRPQTQIYRDGVLSNDTLAANYEYQGGFQSPYGIDVRSNTSHTRVNIYIADTGAHAIKAVCTYNDGGACAYKSLAANAGTAVNAAYNTPFLETIVTSQNTSGTVFNGLTANDGPAAGSSGAQDNVATQPNATGSGLLKFPLDVKVSKYGNLLIADYENHRIAAVCYTTGNGDFCKTGEFRTIATAGNLYTLIGTPNGGGASTEGSSAYLNQIYKPVSLLIAKRYADDYDTTDTTFFDSNILFTEDDSAYGSVPAVGFTAKIVCGADSATPKGLCKSVCSSSCAGKIYTYAGKAGTPGDQNYGSGQSPLLMRFARPSAINYDRQKSLVVSSSVSTLTPGTIYGDWSLRLITPISTTPVIGAKYSFTDSAQQTSYFCLRFQVETLCFGAGCTCTAIPALGGALPVWYGATRNERCP